MTLTVLNNDDRATLLPWIVCRARLRHENYFLRHFWESFQSFESLNLLSCSASLSEHNTIKVSTYLYIQYTHNTKQAHNFSNQIKSNQLKVASSFDSSAHRSIDKFLRVLQSTGFASISPRQGTNTYSSKHSQYLSNSIRIPTVPQRYNKVRSKYEY